MEEKQPNGRANKSLTMTTREGKSMPVPPEGNLGLLALGYRGLMLWREARAASGWTAKKTAELARQQFRQLQEAKAADQKNRGKAESGTSAGEGKV